MYTDGGTVDEKGANVEMKLMWTGMEVVMDFKAMKQRSVIKTKLTACGYLVYLEMEHVKDVGKKRLEFYPIVDRGL